MKTNRIKRMGRHLWLGIFALGCVAGTGQRCDAYQLFGTPIETEEVFLLAPRPLQRLLREGELAMQEGRFAEAVSTLGMILNDSNSDLPADLRGQDFFLEGGTDDLYQTTIRGEAMRLLSELPSAGREILEIQFGVAAQRELEAAIAARDMRAISEVARRFPHTLAGYDAVALLARSKLTDGFPRAAASLFDLLLDAPIARDRFGPALAKNSALCWMLAGQPALAVQVLESAGSSFPNRSIELNGLARDLSAEADWGQLLHQHMQSDASLAAMRSATDWTTSGGNAERNAVADAGLPLRDVRWATRTHGSIPEKQALDAQTSSQAQAKNVILPKFEVRMLGDLLLTKTTDSEVLAIDFETGLTKWAFYRNSAPAKLMSHEFKVGGGQAESGLSDELKLRVWGSSAYGRFSCDNQRMYYITEGAQASPNPRVRGFVPLTRTNQLQAASISGEGKVLWMVGGGDPESPLGNAYFLGPPVAYEGELFAIVDVNGETRLVVLDPESGDLLWSQQLCHPVANAPGVDPGRQSQAISPTISSGVVLCPTGAGAVVAVDLTTRSLRWGVAYRTTNRNSVDRFRGGWGGNQEFDPLEARWHDNGMIAQEGLVAVSPIESNVFFVRDVLTGKAVVSRQLRNGARYLAGIKDSNLYVVSERHVHRYNLVDMTIDWQQQFPEGRTLAGKGLWLDDSLFIPLSGNRVVRYQLEDGKLLESADTAEPVGNLFAHRDSLISVTATQVNVYHTQDALRTRVEERLAQDPEDVWALNHAAQLKVADDQVDAAYGLLRKSFAVQPQNIETQHLLVETLLTGLEQDFDKYEALANELRPIVENSPERSRFLQWLAMGSIRSKKYAEAFENLVGMLRERTQSLGGATPTQGADMRIAEDHQVDTDTWIAIELARCYEQADARTRELLDQRVAEELASVSGLVLSQQQALLKYFLWHPSAEHQVLAAAIALKSRDQQTAAERLLVPLLHSPNPSTVATAHKLLATHPLVDSLRFGPRGQAFNSLYQPSGNLREMEAMAAEGNLPDEFLRPIPWNQGMVRTTVSNERTLYPLGMELPQVSERFGRPAVNLKMSSGVVVVSNDNGEPVARLEIERASADTQIGLNKAHVRGGLIVLETSSGVIGLDLYRGIENGREATLWRQSLVSPNAGPRTPFTQPSTNSVETAMGVQLQQRIGQAVGPLTPGGLIVQQDSQLLALDAYSGKRVWSREGYDQKISFAHDGIRLAVVHPSMGLIEILDCRDGSVLEKRPLRWSQDSHEEQAGDAGKRSRRAKPHIWQNWFAYQNLLVDFREEQSQDETAKIFTPGMVRPLLRIWDPFTGEVLANLDLPRGSRANVCEGRFLVVADQRNQIHYIDLKEERHETWDAPVELRLQAISVERFQDRLVVLSRVDRTDPDFSQLRNMPSLTYREAHGNVYAIDTRSPQLLWTQPGKLSAMFMPLAQPRNSPFMIAYRMNAASSNRVDSNTAAIALVDLRDGRLAFSSPALRVDAFGGFAMRLNPRTQQIEVSLGSRFLLFELEQGPRPPQPAVHFGHATPAEKFDPSFDLLRNRR